MSRVSRAWLTPGKSDAWEIAATIVVVRLSGGSGLGEAPVQSVIANKVRAGNRRSS